MAFITDDQADDRIFSSIGHARMPTAWQVFIDWLCGDARLAEYRRRLEQLRTLACEFERFNATEAEIAAAAAVAGQRSQAAWERRERLVGRLRDQMLANLVNEAKKGAQF